MVDRLGPIIYRSYSNMIGQPVKPMPQLGVFDSGARNDVPGRAHNGAQLQYVRQLLFVGGHGQVLLIGQNEKGFSCQMFVGHQRVEFFPYQLKTVDVVGVHDKRNAVGVQNSAATIAEIWIVHQCPTF